LGIVCHDSNSSTDNREIFRAADRPNVSCGVKATKPCRSACDCGELGISRGTSGFVQRGERTGGAVSAGDRPELERAAAWICVTMRSWKRSIGRVHGVRSVSRLKTTRYSHPQAGLVRKVIDVRMLARAVVHRHVPSNHRACFLQEILRSGHDALDQYGQALMGFLCLPRSLKQPPRSGVVGFWDQGQSGKCARLSARRMQRDVSGRVDHRRR
jgi:hypothetical protein